MSMVHCSNEAPLVSIICPCYNGVECLPALFESVLTQTYKNMELYFADDGSTENVRDVYLRYAPAIKARGITCHYLRQENSGAASAINLALGKIAGEYLFWVDSDDELAPWAIRELTCFLQEHPEYAFAFGDWIHLLPNGKTVRSRDVPTAEDCAHQQALFRQIMNGSRFIASGTCMVRTKSFFTIYPGRRIFPSREGQNLQLVAPMAYFHHVCFLDKWVLKKNTRDASHSNRIRSLEQQSERLQGFEAIREDIARRCNVTAKERREILTINARAMMSCAWKKDKRTYTAQRRRYLRSMRFTAKDFAWLLLGPRIDILRDLKKEL